MKVVRYRDGYPFDAVEIPDEVFAAARTLDAWINGQSDDTVSIYGIGRVLQVQHDHAVLKQKLKAIEEILK